MLKLLNPRSLSLKTVRFSSRLYSTSTNDNKLRIVFFGTDDFASTHLKALIDEKNSSDSSIQSIDLVCPPDRRTGRKLEKITQSETKGLANANNLQVFHAPSQAKDMKDWKIPTESSYDLGVVVSFGYFIPPHIISSLKYGAVNVHPSLLPKYRGAAPIQHAILYGDAETGVTIQELDAFEFDAGRILKQETFDLREKKPVYSELKRTLAGVGSGMLVDTVRHLLERKKNALVQDPSKATKAPKIKKEWSEMDFAHMTAWQAEQLHRAIGEFCPIRTSYQTKKKKDIGIQLLDLSLPINYTAKGEPGSFVYDEQTKSIHIVFGDSSVLACHRLKVENKGVIAAHDFANGYQTEGRFNVSTGIDDITLQKNIKKRQKMKPYGNWN